VGIKRYETYQAEDIWQSQQAVKEYVEVTNGAYYSIMQAFGLNGGIAKKRALSWMK